MPNSHDPTERLVAQAKLGEEPAFVSLIAQVGPSVRRAIDAELEAVQQDLDATQIWSEVQDKARERIGEFQGSSETEFEAWMERVSLRHIRHAARTGGASIETVVKPPETMMQAGDPNATIAPESVEKKLDPNATIAPTNTDTLPPDAFATIGADPHGTIADLAAIPVAPQTTKIFGDYEILETIAKGGMGVVYKARQRKLNRIVALKMILAGQFADQSDIDRFYAEAEAAAQLRHPNIVGIHEVGECEEQHYFSMEYIEGRSLGDLVREHPLAPRSAAKFVKTISEAMQYAHEEGVLHRDLKPSNVLVDNSDVPLVTDFGLAKRTSEQSQLTVAGTILGTPSYMPPEQASGKLDQITARSDVYSLGAILYELITGKPPFGAANPWETIKQVLGDEPVSPRMLNSGVPADLETICLKCLQKDQERRYSSAQDLVDELQRFLAGEPILARPVGFVETAIRWCYRNPWPTAAMGVLLLGVVGTSVGLKVARTAEAEAVSARFDAENSEAEAKASEAKAVTARIEADAAKDKAETSRDQLLAALNELFTAWSDVTLLNEPGFEDVRAQLLATAKDRYERMGEELGDDPKIQQGLGEAYFRLGRMMFHLQSYDDALRSVESGRDIQLQLHQDEPDNEARLHALGESLNLYGNVLELTATNTASGSLDAVQNRLEEAERAYEEAIAKREQLVKAVPDNPEYKRYLLNSQMNHGMVRSRMGRSRDDEGDRLFDNGDENGANDSYDSADPYYEVARERIEAVQPTRHELLNRLDEQVEMLVAEVLRELPDSPQVPAELKEKRLEVRELLAQLAEIEELPTSLNDLHIRLAETSRIRDDVIHDLAQCDYNLAKLTMRLGDYVATDKYLAAAIDEFDTLLTQYPKHLEYQYDQAHCWMLSGSAKSEQPLDADQGATPKTRAVAAIKAYRNAEAILEQLASKSSSVLKYRRDLAQVYLQIGDLHFDVEEYRDALNAYFSAETILIRMVEEFPDDAYVGFLLGNANAAVADANHYIKEAESAAAPSGEKDPP